MFKSCMSDLMSTFICIYAFTCIHSPQLKPTTSRPMMRSSYDVVTLLIPIIMPAAMPMMLFINMPPFLKHDFKTDYI